MPHRLLNKQELSHFYMKSGDNPGKERSHGASFKDEVSVVIFISSPNKSEASLSGQRLNIELCVPFIKKVKIKA